MTLKQSAFGSKCTLPDKFFKDTLNCGILESILGTGGDLVDPEEDVFASEPGTPRGQLPQPCTPRASLQPAPNGVHAAPMAPPPPPMRASTQVVGCSVLHSCP